MIVFWLSFGQQMFWNHSPSNPKYSWSMLCSSLKPGHFFHIVPTFSPMLETIWCVIKSQTHSMNSTCPNTCFILGRSDISTWNCWLEKQRHGQQEPWILAADAPSASHTSRSGVNMLHLKNTVGQHTTTLHIILHNHAISRYTGQDFTRWHSSALMLGWSHFQLSWFCSTKTIVCLMSEEFKLGHALFENNWENIYTK